MTGIGIVTAGSVSARRHFAPRFGGSVVGRVHAYEGVKEGLPTKLPQKAGQWVKGVWRKGWLAIFAWRTGIHIKPVFNRAEHIAMAHLQTDFKKTMIENFPHLANNPRWLRRVATVIGEVLGTLVSRRNRHLPMTPAEDKFMDTFMMLNPAQEGERRQILEKVVTSLGFKIPASPAKKGTKAV